MYKMLSETQKAVMTQHINYLCELLTLDKLYITTIEAASIWIEEKMVWIPVLNGPMSYYVALHEIGHFVTKEESEDILEKEVLAWNWAFDIGKIGVTKAVYRRAAQSLRRYKVGYDGTPPESFNKLLSSVETRI